MTPTTRWASYVLDELERWGDPEPIEDSWWQSIEEMDAREESENGCE